MFRNPCGQPLLTLYPSNSLPCRGEKLMLLLARPSLPIVNKQRPTIGQRRRRCKACLIVRILHARGGSRELSMAQTLVEEYAMLSATKGRHDPVGRARSGQIKHLAPDGALANAFRILLEQVSVASPHKTAPAGSDEGPHFESNLSSDQQGCDEGECA